MIVLNNFKNKPKK
jgi:hypothetical protein